MAARHMAGVFTAGSVRLCLTPNRKDVKPSFIKSSPEARCSQALAQFDSNQAFVPSDARCVCPLAFGMDLQRLQEESRRCDARNDCKSIGAPGQTLPSGSQAKHRIGRPPDHGALVDLGCLLPACPANMAGAGLGLVRPHQGGLGALAARQGASNSRPRSAQSSWHVASQRRPKPQGHQAFLRQRNS